MYRSQTCENHPGGEGATEHLFVVGGVLITRWIGRDEFFLRREFGRFWTRFRARAADLPPRLPRLWDI